MSATNGKAFGATTRGAVMYALAAGSVLVLGAILYMALVLDDVDARALVLTAGAAIVTAGAAGIGGKVTPTDQQHPERADTPPDPEVPTEYEPVEPAPAPVAQVDEVPRHRA